MIQDYQYSALDAVNGVRLRRGWGGGCCPGIKGVLTVLLTLPSLRCLKVALEVFSKTHRFHSPALQGVELAHQFDQRVGGRFGHQGGDGACAGGFGGALCSVWERRVLHGPPLVTLEGGGGWRQSGCKSELRQYLSRSRRKRIRCQKGKTIMPRGRRTSGQADVQLAARHLRLEREAAGAPRGAGAAAAGPQRGGFPLGGPGRAQADLAAQRPHQTHGQGRGPLGGGGGG